jgi:hypothetical protein
MLQPFSISISSILKTNVKFSLPAIIQTIINVDENSDTGERKNNADPRRLTHADQDPEHCSKPKSPIASITDWPDPDRHALKADPYPDSDPAK